LFAVSNCSGALRVRNVGEGWARDLLASARVPPARLDRVLYYPVAHRPACYRISILFTPMGKTTNTRLNERTAVRCDRGAWAATDPLIDKAEFLAWDWAPAFAGER
jgi:hypothetical protein